MNPNISEMRENCFTPDKINYVFKVFNNDTFKIIECVLLDVDGDTAIFIETTANRLDVRIFTPERREKMISTDIKADIKNIAFRKNLVQKHLRRFPENWDILNRSKHPVILELLPKLKDPNDESYR